MPGPGDALPIGATHGPGRCREQRRDSWPSGPATARRFRHGIRGAVIGAIVVLTLTGCRTLMESDRAARDVLSAIRENGRAPVMIALVTPAGAADAANPQATRAEIARMQDEVIAALDPADFRVGARYTSVPALAGLLLSERGLRRLLAHPFVVRISLDSGGTGHG